MDVSTSGAKVRYMIYRKKKNGKLVRASKWVYEEPEWAIRDAEAFNKYSTKDGETFVPVMISTVTTITEI